MHASTRDRLLDAGEELFGSRGFVAVSTRELAAAAGTTLPSIPHHFGSKEGLYQAVLLRVASRLVSQLPPAPAIDGEADERTLVETAEVIVVAFADALLSEDAHWASLMVREQLEPTPAGRDLRNMLAQELVVPIAQLVARVNKRSSPTVPDQLRAMTLVGQALIFRIGQPMVTRVTGWSEVGHEEKDQILRVLRDGVANSLRPTRA